MNVPPTWNSLAREVSKLTSEVEELKALIKALEADKERLEDELKAIKPHYNFYRQEFLRNINEWIIPHEGQDIDN